MVCRTRCSRMLNVSLNICFFKNGLIAIVFFLRCLFPLYARGTLSQWTPSYSWPILPLSVISSLCPCYWARSHWRRILKKSPCLQSSLWINWCLLTSWLLRLWLVWCSFSPPPGYDCEHICMFVNRNCRDRWHKITPASSERHSDIAFFLSSQPSPHTLHPHQIFFYSGLRGCEEGGCAESWPTLNADILLSTLLQFLCLPHDCACTHTCSMKSCTQSVRCCFFFLSFFVYIHLGANHSAHFLCRFNHRLFEP